MIFHLDSVEVALESPTNITPFISSADSACQSCGVLFHHLQYSPSLGSDDIVLFFFNVLRWDFMR